MLLIRREEVSAYWFGGQDSVALTTRLRTQTLFCTVSLVTSACRTFSAWTHDVERNEGEKTGSVTSRTVISDLCFNLAVAGDAVDTLHVVAQWWEVEKHSVCKTERHVSLSPGFER